MIWRTEMNERDISIDILKGILIILVVMGHYTRDIFHDVVLLFHMPLFFMISGFLQSPIKNRQKLIKKIKRLILPYVVYILVDYLLIKRSFSLPGLLQIVWGGRYADGVYWYITCYLVVLCLFFMIRKASARMQKALIFVGEGYQFLNRIY